MSFHSLLTGLVSIPSQCAVCKSWPTQQVCKPCVARFAPVLLRCTYCALALPTDLSLGLRTGPAICGSCLQDRPPTDVTLAALPYAFPWSTLISGFKFGEQHGWASYFAHLLNQSPGVAEVFKELAPQDWVLPLPLSTERLTKRGFNQSWELVRALNRQTQTKAQSDARLLLKIRHTPPQSQLKRDARLANVKGAFQVDPLRVSEIEGRRVILIDDVMTSGASIFTAAQVLKDAGAVHITAVVLARTAAA